jgi:hypothetical protein
MPLRVNADAASALPLSFGLDPPIVAVLSSVDGATEGVDLPSPPVPTNFLSCVQ